MKSPEQFTKTYRVAVGESQYAVTNGELAQYRASYGGPAEIAGRMSELIWLDIYIYDKAFGISPYDILNSIDELEGMEQQTGTKPPTKFRKLPLKGLSHKHFFSAQFLVPNILLGLGASGLHDLVNQEWDSAKSPIITQQMIDSLSRRVVLEPFEQRDARKELTGEWIIYLRRENLNFYLCCNTHNAGDQFIFDRIVEHCAKDYPCLSEWIDAARLP